MLHVKSPGGANSKLDLSLATATPEDVLLDKTFFSALSEELQTGILSAADGLKRAEGTISSDKMLESYTVSGLEFTPKIIIFRAGDLNTSLSYSSNMISAYYFGKTLYSVWYMNGPYYSTTSISVSDNSFTANGCYANLGNWIAFG